MAKLVFYDADPKDQQTFQRLFKDHQTVFVTEPLSETNIVADADVVSIFVSSQLDSKNLAKFTSLQHVTCRSTGYNHVDLAECQKRQISVSNVPTYGEHTVAEYTFGLMLSLARKLPVVINASAKGQLEPAVAQGLDLYGKTLGVIGTGRIGQRVIEIAAAFGMKIVAYDPFPNQSTAQALKFEYMEPLQLAKTADIVTIHARYSGDNRHFIGEEFFKTMKPGSLLVNTARGELVDTRALVLALESGRLGGAALDVLEGEHLLDSREELALLRAEATDTEKLQANLEINLLAKLPNVILTYHNAYNTAEAVDRIRHTSAANIEKFLTGNPQNLVHE